ncbi:unnamed protein product [Rhizophagus irregularis]|nr:unnamed protein product [Rhizophagus irregularis]
MHKVILKKLENVESADRSWFDECKSHLSITNKWSKQKEYQSIQHNLSIPSEIEDFVFKRTEHQIGQYDLTIIMPDNSKSKRIYFDDEEKEDIIKSKKIKLSENKGKFQYSQMNYVTNNNVMEDDDISNNPNFHSEDQEELEIPEDI